MNTHQTVKSSVGVVGAGIQGVCISLSLIKKGFKVLQTKDCHGHGCHEILLQKIK